MTESAQPHISTSVGGLYLSLSTRSTQCTLLKLVSGENSAHEVWVWVGLLSVNHTVELLSEAVCFGPKEP